MSIEDERIRNDTEYSSQDTENLQQMQQQTQKQPHKYLYVFYKNRYYFQGGFTAGGIGAEIQKLESVYGAGSVIASDYPNEEETLNRHLMVEGVGETVEKVGEYVEEHYGENIREGLKITPEAKKEFKETFQRPGRQQQRQYQGYDYYERKIPPGCQRYSPVTKEQSFISYRPAGRVSRAPLFKPIPITFLPVQHQNKGYHQGGNRGAGFIPHFATFKFIKFGRRY